MLLTVLALLMFVILSVGCFLVIVGTLRKNKWGVNTARLTCPQCGNAPGHLRLPKTVGQFLWGGVTCNRCGIEVDKWGRPAARSNPS
jgi:hypothetical protein